MTTAEETPDTEPRAVAATLRPSASLDRYFATRQTARSLPGILVRALASPPTVTQDPTLIPYRLHGDPERGRHLLQSHNSNGMLPILEDETRGQATATGAGAGPLQSFVWLEDLVALRSGPAIRLAQDITAAWLASHNQGQERAWSPVQMAHRLIWWIRTAPLLTLDASDRFRSDLTRSIAGHAAILSWCRWLMRDGQGRITIETALLLSTVFLNTPSPLAPRNQHTYARHIQRWLRQAITNHNTTPQEILRVGFLHALIIEACRQTDTGMTSALTGTRHELAGLLASLSLSDQELCRLASGGMTPAGLLPATRATLGVASPASTRTQASCISLAGTGLHAVLNTRGPRNGSGEIHPSALSVELATDGEILLTDTGPTAGFGNSLAAWVHGGHGCSTLSLSSTPFPPGDSLPSRSPAPLFGTLTRSREDVARASRARASHTGFRGTFHATIERSVSLRRDGTRLEGLDSVTLDEPGQAGLVHARLTFNLHPMVDVIEDRSESTGIQLRLPSGTLWRFTLAGTPAPTIAESIFVDDLHHEIWKTSRLLVHDTLTTHQTHFAWCFEQLAG